MPHILLGCHPQRVLRDVPPDHGHRFSYDPPHQRGYFTTEIGLAIPRRFHGSSLCSNRLEVLGSIIYINLGRGQAPEGILSPPHGGPVLWEWFRPRRPLGRYDHGVLYTARVWNGLPLCVSFPLACGYLFDMVRRCDAKG